MVLRQAQALALILLAAIALVAAAALAWFGAAHPLVPLRHAPRPLTAAEAALAFPLMAGAYHIVYHRLARVRRWRRNLIRAGGAFATSWVGTVALILAKQLTAIVAALGTPVDPQRTLAVVIGMLLLWRANLLPKSRPGWLNGVALPVFAPDSISWRIVHGPAALRVAAIGTIAIVMAFAAPAGVDIRTPIMALLVAELLLANTHALLLSTRR